jgi:hypothetical protein
LKNIGVPAKLFISGVPAKSQIGKKNGVSILVCPWSLSVKR